MGSVTVINHKEQLHLKSYWITRGNSVLCNPFKVGTYGVPTRDIAIQKFAMYLKREMVKHNSPLRQRIFELAELVNSGEDVRLRCVCKPKSCHGDIVKEVIDQVVIKIKTGIRAAKPVSIEFE